MSTYRVEWPCCDSVTETEGYEPEACPFCNEPEKGSKVSREHYEALERERDGLVSRVWDLEDALGKALRYVTLPYGVSTPTWAGLEATLSRSPRHTGVIVMTKQQKQEMIGKPLTLDMYKEIQAEALDKYAQDVYDYDIYDDHSAYHAVKTIADKLREGEW